MKSMDLLNMTNRAPIYEIYEKVKERNSFFSNQSFQIWRQTSGIEVYMEKYKISAQNI